MANKRNLKKNIDYLIYEIVSDCYTFKYLFPDKDQKEVDKILKEAVNFRNELIKRVNHPDGKENKKLVKNHYKKVNQDLMEKVDNYIDRLNKMLGDTQKEAEPKKEKQLKEAAKPNEETKEG